MDKKKCIIDKYSTVYSYDVFVVINPDKDALNKRFTWCEEDREFYNSDYDDRVAITCSNVTDLENNKYCFVIIVNSIRDDIDLANTSAHEATHAAHDILSECRIKLSEDTEEAYAYLVGYISECIFKTASKR